MPMRESKRYHYAMELPAGMAINPADAIEPTVNGSTDEHLAALAAAGDHHAFERLVERWRPRIRSLIRKRVPGNETAEDLTQETLLRAWKSLERYDPSRPLKTWLFTIAVRVAIDHRRAAAPRAMPTLENADAAVAPQGDRSEAAETAAELWRTADRVLGETERAAIWLRYAEDMPVNEIARVLGKSRVATSVMMFRAREKLAAAMTE